MDLRIAIFSPSLNETDGNGNITRELCMRLQKNARLTLFLPETRGSPDGKLSGCRVRFTLPPFIFHLKNRHVWEYLNWSPAESEVDIVHAPFAFPYALLAKRMAEKLGKPLIIGAQGTFGVEPLTHEPERRFLSSAYNAARKIHVPSAFTKEKILEFSETRTKIEVIPNGVDLQRFQRKINLSSVRRRFGPGPLLLGVGGLKLRKGFDVAIRAISGLKRKYPSLRYLIVGDGEERQALQALIRSEDLEENVLLLGEKRGEDLVRLFRLCDLYLHTPRSIRWNFEGFGIVYLEANACGKPVVASASGGVPSAVVNGKTGILVPEESQQETTAAIDLLLSNKSLYKKLSDNAKRWAAKHDWNLITRQYERMYRTVYEQKRTRIQED